MGFAFNFSHSDFRPIWKKDNRKDKNDYTVVFVNGKKKTQTR